MCDLTFRGGSLSFHRADVQQVFLAHISSAVRVHLNRRLVSYRESDRKIYLSFKSGEMATCDFLIGADGVNSVVRREFLATTYNLSQSEAIREARPLWTGTIVYRSVIKSDIIRREIADHPCLVKPLVVRPLNSRLVNSVTEPQMHYFSVLWKKQGNYIIRQSQRKLTRKIARCLVPHFRGQAHQCHWLRLRAHQGRHFPGWACCDKLNDGCRLIFLHRLVGGGTMYYKRTSRFSRCICQSAVRLFRQNMSNPLRWAIEVVKPLDKYGSGRVALLGDSVSILRAHNIQ